MICLLNVCLWFHSTPKIFVIWTHCKMGIKNKQNVNRNRKRGHYFAFIISNTSWLDMVMSSTVTGSFSSKGDRKFTRFLRKSVPLRMSNKPKGHHYSVTCRYFSYERINPFKQIRFFLYGERKILFKQVRFFISSIWGMTNTFKQVRFFIFLYSWGKRYYVHSHPSF